MFAGFIWGGLSFATGLGVLPKWLGAGCGCKGFGGVLLGIVAWT